MTDLPPARSVLVTGASGLIGRQVVARLAGQADVDTVVATDVRETAAQDREDGVVYEIEDIREAVWESLTEARE